jgi:adenine-specific DNA-methyltransferase
VGFKINNRRYTGSKSKIVSWIRNLVLEHCKGATSLCDIFAGTGVVANSLIDDFTDITLNDFLFSNEIIYNAFFGQETYNEDRIFEFFKKYKRLSAEDLTDNYVSDNYGNKFFSFNDAKKIGYIREDLELNKQSLTKREFDILLASLIYSFDKAANTVGHYEAYIKNGNISDTFKFDLIEPTRFIDKKTIKIFRQDANLLAKKISADIVYIDPPYSSRQYSRFYHLIETIVKWDKPKLFGTALKPKPENMSEYCTTAAINSFRELVSDLKCKYIVVSYNNTYSSKSKSSENKMKLEDIKKILDKKGLTEQFSIKHQAFNAGKTNFDNHQEILFITKVEV